MQSSQSVLNRENNKGKQMIQVNIANVLIEVQCQRYGCSTVNYTGRLDTGIISVVLYTGILDQVYYQIQVYYIKYILDTGILYQVSLYTGILDTVILDQVYQIKNIISRILYQVYIISSIYYTGISYYTGIQINQMNRQREQQTI